MLRSFLTVFGFAAIFFGVSVMGALLTGVGAASLRFPVARPGTSAFAYRPIVQP